MAENYNREQIAHRPKPIISRIRRVCGYLTAVVVVLIIITPFVIPRIDRSTRLINSHRIDAVLRDMQHIDAVLKDYRAAHDGKNPESLRELENYGWLGASTDRIRGRTSATSYQWFYDPLASAARPIVICYVNTAENKNAIWLTADGRIYQGRVFMWPAREHKGVE